MSDENGDTNTAEQHTEEASDMPKYHLYIRASLIDGQSLGACPICQQGFMISYILAEEKNADFKVWTVNTLNPPAEFLEKNRARIYPFIEGISGNNYLGQAIADYTPDSSDDVEKFFESINSDCPELKRPTSAANSIYPKIDKISTKMNAFLKGHGPDGVNAILKLANDHLATSGTKFLDGNKLSYADCFFLPRLQHIRVAGKVFRDYEIPTELSELWKYLEDAYKTMAFSETTPTDEDILKYHWEKYSDAERSLFRKKGIRDNWGSPKGPVPTKTLQVPDFAKNGTVANDDED